MAEDAARSGAKGDADPNQKGDNKADAGPTGGTTVVNVSDQPDVEKIVAARLNQKLKAYGDLDELKRKAEAFEQSENAKKSEAERFADQRAAVERERADLDREKQELRVRSATITHAARLGFRDPQDAYALLDPASLEFDKAGEPTNVEAQLRSLLESKPYLSGSQAPVGSYDGGVRQTPPTTPSMNDLLRAAKG